VFYEDCGIVISCDENGLVEVYNATPVKGSDVVLVKEGLKDLSANNPEFVINLILGGKKVEVSFLFECVINPSENIQGVLLGDMVLLNDNECGPGLYKAITTDDANKVLVNLDEDSTDYLIGNGKLLIDLLTAQR
jgi:hypothetical protein